MENTKIYAVIASVYGMGLGSNKTILKAFLSKKDAEYFCWKKKMDEDSNPFLSRSHSVVVEVAMGSQNFEEKLFKQFVKERTEEIKKQIAEKTNCADSDNSQIAKLNEELASY